MNRVMPLLILIALAGCTTREEPRMPAEAMEPIVKEYAFGEMPTLNPSTRFKIEEYRMEGLWKVLQIQLFLARYLSPDGQRFNARRAMTNAELGRNKWQLA